MLQQNIVLDKSYLFALRIIKLYVYLRSIKKEYLLSAQIVRSGTSIGANIEEATGGSSRKDFKAKLDIAYKEARETRYWIRLFRDSAILDSKLADSLLKDCEELIKLLTAIINTLKATL
ncbi:MAG: four helix bundle protein [Chitinophagaceae bacterium]|nr:four helix bundle protein [Bacteroidota bacterium]TAJ64440.1 MAG: four helix bundle protein [Chitinophagaceae bacterium]